MENFNQYCLTRALVTTDGDVAKELNNLINRLDKCFKKDSDNFAETCFVIYKIKKLFDDYKQVYVYGRKNETYNFDTIMQGFGISKSESSRILSCYDKFITKETDKPMLLAEFYGFSKSKLFELLQIENTQIVQDLKNNVLRFDFTVKQIRDYVKNLQELKRQQAKLDKTKEEKTKKILTKKKYQKHITHNDIMILITLKKRIRLNYLILFGSCKRNMKN